MECQRTVVIFGAGYVGGALAVRLVASGRRVVALTRNAERAAGLRALGVRVVEARLEETSWHGDIEGPVEAAVNCVSSGGAGLDGYRTSYVDGMASVMAWARGARPGLVAYTGSTSVYPQGGGEEVDETAPVGGAGDLAEVLLEAEGRLRDGPSPWCILRLAGIYGPGRHHLLDALRSGAGVLSGNAADTLNLIHRDDAAGGLMACLGAPRAAAGNVFNLADAGRATRGEVGRWLAGRLGVPEPRFDGTAGPRRRLTPDRVIVADKARRVLGWVPEYPDFRAGYSRILGG